MADTKKYLDYQGLVHLWSLLKTKFVFKDGSKGLSTNDFTDTYKTKLDGIQAGAEENVKSDWNAQEGDAQILNKPVVVSSIDYDSTNKKITKTIGNTTSDVVTINSIKSDLNLSQNDITNALNYIPISSSEKGQSGGICPLNNSSKIDSQYLPSYVDDVIEAYARSGQTELSQNWLAINSSSGSVISPESGKIYVLMVETTNYPINSQFRWGGTSYVKLNDGGITKIENSEIDDIIENELIENNSSDEEE